MQFEIMKPTLDKPLPSIEFNNEELKAELKVQLDKYKDVELTEAQVREGKQEVAKLRKLKTAIDDKRKDVKRYYLAPLDEFERKIKEITSMIDEPITAIDNQVKAFEEAECEEKLDQVRNYISDRSKYKKLEFVSYDQLYSPKWKNKGSTFEVIQKEVDAALDDISAKHQSISTLELNHAFEAMEAFKLTLDINQAIAEESRLNALDEKKRIAEQMKRESVLDESKEFTNKPEFDDFTPPPSPETFTVKFSVTGTKEQLMFLSSFLRNNGINFEQIKE